MREDEQHPVDEDARKSNRRTLIAIGIVVLVMGGMAIIEMLVALNQS